MTSFRMGLTVFTAWASWTQMPSSIWQRHQKSSYNKRRGQRRRFILRLDSNNVDTSIHLLPLLMGCLGWRQQPPWKGQPVTLQQSGSNPTIGCADTSTVGSPSIFCGRHTGTSGGPGYRLTKLASITWSGKTAPGSTSSGKHAKIYKDWVMSSLFPQPP